MAIGFGIPIGKFDRRGADFTPYMQMKEMEMQAARDRQAEAEFRAGLDQSRQAMALDQAQFGESQRQFDAGLAESREARAAQERIAAQRQQGKSGTNDLTAREELLYDHLNEQLAMAKYLHSKAQTSEDRARYQAEIDRLQGEILRILKPGEQAAAPGILPSVARVQDLDKKPIVPGKVDSRPKAEKIVERDDGAKGTAEPAAPEAKPKELLPPSIPPKEVTDKLKRDEQMRQEREAKQAQAERGLRENDYAKLYRKLGLSPAQAREAASAADIVADAAAKGSEPNRTAMDYYFANVPGARELYDWWLSVGRQGKPSDLLR